MKPSRSATLASRCRVAIVAGLLASTAAAVHANQTAAAPIIREADRLRNAGQLTAAVELLRGQLARQPDDGDAARMLGGLGGHRRAQLRVGGH